MRLARWLCFNPTNQSLMRVVAWKTADCSCMDLFMSLAYMESMGDDDHVSSGSKAKGVQLCRCTSRPVSPILAALPSLPPYNPGCSVLAALQTFSI